MANNAGLALEISGSTATITFAAENGINVLSTTVLNRLSELVSQASEAPGVRTMVIAAEGKVFIAGADIKEMQRFGKDEARAYGTLGQRVFNAIERFPAVTVAAINGAAMGGGLEVALACDFRIAVKSAKLGLPEVTLGLIPGWNGIPRLSRLIGPSKAKKLFLSGMPISAADAEAIGLVDETVNSTEDLGMRIPAFCKSFKLASPQAVTLAKRAFNQTDDLEAFADAFVSDDARQGLSAFVEKKTAPWTE